MSADGMTKGDRDQLVKLAERRSRLAKAGVAVREAELRADVERQLAAKYDSDHAAWAEITAKADAAVKAADDEIAAISREMGVPEEFRPSIVLGWQSRGENRVAGRRVELRKVAQSAIEAAGRRAKLTIEARTLDVVTVLVSGGLETAEARVFLESIPTPEQLMPIVDVKELRS